MKILEINFSYLEWINDEPPAHINDDTYEYMINDNGIYFSDAFLDDCAKIDITEPHSRFFRVERERFGIDTLIFFKFPDNFTWKDECMLENKNW